MNKKKRIKEELKDSVKFLFKYSSFFENLPDKLTINQFTEELKEKLNNHIEWLEKK